MRSGVFPSALLLLVLGAACRATPHAAVGDVVRDRAPLPASRFPSPDRPVSRIVSPSWTDETTRDDAGEAAEVLAALGVSPGDRVADIGAGSGYYTVRLSRLVGPAGRVHAEDITPSYVASLRERVGREGLENVTVTQGDAHDPKLADTTVDLAIMIHMYHEIEQPFALLANLAPALRPGARLAVVDMDAPTGSHGTPPALLACELRAVGYRQRSVMTLRNNNGYLAVFDAPRPADVPAPERVLACPAP